MNARYNFVTAVIAGLVVLSQASARQLTEADAAVTMSPMKGVTFDVGAERAVSYFVSDNGRCRLVLTKAGQPNWTDATFTATRFEATIDAGKSTRYESNDGSAIVFDCRSDARSVSIRGVDPTLANAQ